MAREHKHSEQIDLDPDEDFWPLLAEAERLLAGRLPKSGSGVFNGGVYLTDSGGSGQHKTVAEARAEVAASRHTLDYVSLWRNEDHDIAGFNRRTSRKADVDADTWIHERSRTVNVIRNIGQSHFVVRVTGPVESEAVGMVKCWPTTCGPFVNGLNSRRRTRP